VTLKNKTLIQESVKEICNLFKVDHRLGLAITDISLDKFNPDRVGINKVSGSITLATKELMGMNFQNFL